MDHLEQFRAQLPPALAARLRSARIADGTATAVFDVAGMDAPARDALESGARAALSQLPGVAAVRVALMADRPQRQIIAVGSGKGGVGKSTVAANLAVALARAGRKVGLVDADIYGPSQAKLLGAEGIQPEARDNKMIPVETQWGVPVLSMGQLIAPGKAIAWRGPMVGNALGQLIDAHWGETELLLIDLPPGTGDVHLTMLQKFKPAGAVIVSTPQDLALIDMARAVDLFDQLSVPVIGMIENMAGYACPHCHEISDPFGSGGLEAAATARGTPFLGRIPLSPDLRRDSDAGRPPAAGEGPQAESFAAIARQILDWTHR